MEKKIGIKSSVSYGTILSRQHKEILLELGKNPKCCEVEILVIKHLKIIRKMRPFDKGLTFIDSL